MQKNDQKYTLVMDIGKTHVKIHVLDASYTSVFSQHISNKVVDTPEYPSSDVATIWQFFQSAIKQAAEQYLITSLSITTHGATAALINRNAEPENALVLPVLDYEYETIYTDSTGYEAVRPDFKQTCSPSLPAGLNLGRQLYWQQQNFPEQFSQATDILMYPQYWIWLFTGHLSSEITSLGCHTDLWDIEQNQLSSLVDALDCKNKFPPLEPAWQNCGTVKAELAAELGLPADCAVFNGLHDSNASFLRYRLTQGSQPFTVISTGTWTITMASQVSVSNLNPAKDMLANIDALGTPIACARFMGGREFGEICQQTGCDVADAFTAEDLQAVINSKVFALPNFAGGSGPFGDAKASFVGDYKNHKGVAIATLYTALLVDYQLSQLDAQGDIYIEGAFLKNPLLCGLIGQLRPEQTVYLSMDDTGTVAGTAALTNWGAVDLQVNTSIASVSKLNDIQAYKQAWLEQISANC
ncbi:L-fuculokinase [Catenovulum agarivorans DS-2]|uniref:L-fuculokinase n=1 Tax=Catenovulum agarivorans DS-2 TaxID=1328313 RepID=W7QNE4_9ALTE|nr:FGGY family carbohydrate kinase [Catenovulum agarivorans]EWH10477.1 L-fuculokinase [Catenovulum agarivorans DS-2]